MRADEMLAKGDVDGGFVRLYEALAVKVVLVCVA